MKTLLLSLFPLILTQSLFASGGALVTCLAEHRGMNEQNQFQVKTAPLIQSYKDVNIQNLEVTFADKNFSAAYWPQTKEITLRIIDGKNSEQGISSLGGFDLSGTARIALVSGGTTYRLVCERH